MSNSQTLTVRGQKVRSASKRRYVVVLVTPQAYDGLVSDIAAWRANNYQGRIPTKMATIPAGAEVRKRSDSLDTAYRYASQCPAVAGRTFPVVVDQVTGQEIRSTPAGVPQQPEPEEQQVQPQGLLQPRD